MSEVWDILNCQARGMGFAAKFGLFGMFVCEGEGRVEDLQGLSLSRETAPRTVKGPYSKAKVAMGSH